ncbi:alginate lyase family protein [soil metagenome]
MRRIQYALGLNGLCTCAVRLGRLNFSMPSTTRRQFLNTAATLTLAPRLLAKTPSLHLATIESNRVLGAADRYLNESPITITATPAPRSAGGLHDFFSEGDYWWPDPKNPGGPYVRRDGFSNPANFVAHRQALLRLSVQMPVLTAAWRITRDKKYSTKAAEYLRAWFVTPATRMNPNLEYAQAITGVTPGRGIGIIDTLHLVEVARASSLLDEAGQLGADAAAIKAWFTDYLSWMTTSKNGIEERDAKNNHGSCWVLQAAEFARYTRNAAVTQFCIDRFKNNLIPDQVAADGSLPLELARTKPYSYSLFCLDVLATICQVVSSQPGAPDLWHFTPANKAGIEKAVAFMTPYIRDKKTWPHPPDVEYFNDLPVRQPSLLFAGLAYSRPDYIARWRKLPADPSVEEIVRNFPIRQPVLWVPATDL